MSHLLKRTKKSCLKILRKISSSKQLFAKKTADDADDAANNNYSNNNNDNNQAKTDRPHTQNGEQTMDLETSGKLKKERAIIRTEETLPSRATYHREPENEICPMDIANSIDEDSPNNTILHKLTTRLFLTADGYDFHRLQHMRSDTGSEVVQFDVDVDATELNEDEIVFEKMKYKNDIRYFRHTPPSNSSLDNFRCVDKMPLDCGGGYASKCDFNIDDGRRLNNTNTNTNGNTNDSDSNNNNSNKHFCNNQFTNFGFQSAAEIFRPKINLSLGSKLNSNQQNVIILEERRNNNNKLTPVVKWDINGNSLDDDDDLLPHEYLENFDKRLSKRLAAVQQLQTTIDNNYENESSDSSLKSSSTTLETWLDEDLIYENPLSDNMELKFKGTRCLIKAEA